MGVSHFSSIHSLKDATVGGNLTVIGATNLQNINAQQGTFEEITSVNGTFTGNMNVIGSANVNSEIILGDSNTYISKDEEEFNISTDKDMILTSDGAISKKAQEEYFCIEKTAAENIPANALCEMDSNGDIILASPNSTCVLGVNKEGEDVSSQDPILVGVSGVMKVVADSLVEGGTLLKVGYNGKVLRLVTGDLANSVIGTGSGGDFQNQPSGDAVEVGSDNDADTTQKVTLYGTRVGQGNTIFTETITLNGTTFVSSTITDWDKILGVEIDNTTSGNITIREASGDLTITTISPGNTQSGIHYITEDSRAFNTKPIVKANGTTSKTIGVVGKGIDHNPLTDSTPLNDTNPVTMNQEFNSIEKLLTGDLESTLNATITVGEEDPWDRVIGRSLEKTPENQTFLMMTI